MSSRFHVLRRLFFNRLFCNEVLSLDLESAGLAHFFTFLGVPGAIIAASLGSQYSSRQYWATVGDQYFFVTYSFVAVSLAALLQWEMLLPDREDWQVLGPLPLPRDMVAGAKLCSLGVFFGLVIAGANAFSVVMMPAIASITLRVAPPWRMFMAQLLAVVWAGLVAAAGFVGIRALLALLPWGRLRQTASAAAQTVGVAALLNVLFTAAVLGPYLRVLLEKHLGVLCWFPSCWALAVQQYVVYGIHTRPEFLALLRAGLTGSGIVFGASALAYSVAVRVEAFRTVQAAQNGCLWYRRRGILGRIMERLVLQERSEIATFHFITSTIARSARHRMYLSSYIGLGLACAVPAVVRVGLAGPGLRLLLSPEGLLNATLVLSFCLVSGLRIAIAFPVQLRANWIFMMTETGAAPHLSATRKWVISYALAPLFLALLPLHLALWPLRSALIHWTSGVVAALFMTEALFWNLRVIPFTAPPPPRRPATVIRAILYLIVLPPFIMTAVEWERWTAGNWVHTVLAFASAAVLLLGLRSRQRARLLATTADFEQLPPETMVRLNLRAVGDNAPVARNN